MLLGREGQKEKLRSGMVQTQEQEEKPRRSWTTVVLVLAAVLLAGVVGTYIYMHGLTYADYEVLWEREFTGGSLTEYLPFSGGILRVTLDGASFVDGSGEVRWSEGYEMHKPLARTRGSYAIIADRQGTRCLVFSTEGKLGEAELDLPICNAALSLSGNFVLASENTTASFINYFTSSGDKLDIEIKAAMEKSGYPVSLALSDDGTRLMCAYGYIDGQTVKSRTAFYDFSEIGKNVSSRLVAGFDDLAPGSIIADVRYLKDPDSVAFSGKGAVFFSSENLTDPKTTEAAAQDGRVEQVFSADAYAGFILRSDTDDSRHVYLWDASGSPVLDMPADFEYDSMNLGKNALVFTCGRQVLLYALSGRKRAELTLDRYVTEAWQGEQTDTLLVCSDDRVMKIKLKSK